jgi:hypothetical protein
MLFGAVIVAVYLAAATVTGVVRHGDVRPLYDGFLPPSSYRFVDPPQFFASGNVKPESMSTSISLGPDGSQPAGFSTPDGQFVVSLPRAAIPAAAAETTVTVRVTPLAPRNADALPRGLRPNGNAYRVDMSYTRSGTTVTRFAKPGTLLIGLPEIGNHLFFSAGAATWSQLPSRAIPPRELSLTASFAAPGYYMAATSLPELTAQPGHSRRTAVVLGVVTAVVAIGLFAGAYIVVVRRRRRAIGREVPDAS